MALTFREPDDAAPDTKKASQTGADLIFASSIRLNVTDSVLYISVAEATTNEEIEAGLKTIKAIHERLTAHRVRHEVYKRKCSPDRKVEVPDTILLPLARE